MSREGPSFNATPCLTRALTAMPLPLSLRRPPLRPAPLALALRLALCGATALATGHAGAQPAPAPATPAGAAQRHDIPAGPLGAVLARFAADSGVLLAAPSALVQGRQSPGLRGSHSEANALAALLQGTGLQAQRQPDGSYALRETVTPAIRPASPAPARPTTPARQDAAPTELPLDTLPHVSVRAAHEPGTTTTDAASIRRLPAPNNDVLSVLRQSPSLRYANTRDSALTQGELAPPEISIHGAKPYQNLFLLDGLSLNNDIDPVSRVATSVADVPGTPLGMPIDKELICELQLLDSNISAEHGNFQGGVVKAELCEARAALAGRVTLKLARSAWQTLYVDPAEAAALEQSTNEDRQARWDKQFWTVQLEGRPTAELGIVAQGSYAQSKIPLRGYAASMTPGDETLAAKEQRRTQRDGMVKLTWRPDAQTSAWLSVREQPLADRYFIVNGRNSNFEVQGGGRAVSTGAQHVLGDWTLRHDLSISEVRQSRRSDADVFRVWSWSATDKNWGDGTRGTSSISTEGSWGDIDSRQRDAAYKLKLTRSAHIEALGGQHRLSAGLDLSQREAFYARPEALVAYIGTTAYRVATSTCTSPLGVVDTESCSLAPSARFPTSGQFWRYRDVYRAGSFDVQAGQYALWLQDAMRWGALNVRAGLRADRDELARTAVLAPRLSATWAFGPRRATELDAGLNRYYGRSLFGMVVREKQATLQTQEQRRASDWAWVSSGQSLPANRLKELDVPYDDELRLGVRHRFLGGLTVAGSWVHREARDQITRVRERDTSGNYANNQAYSYQNNGRGSADTLALEVSPWRPFKALAGTHGWQVSVGQSKRRSNHNTYDDTLTDAQADEPILYRGQVIRYGDRPVENFNAPWAAHAQLQSEFPAADIALVQTLRWQGGYQRVVDTGRTETRDGVALAVHELTSFPATLSWDVSLRWEPHLGRHRPFVQLSVRNLSNRRNVIAISATGVVSYESGRAATLQVGYGF